MRIFLFLIFLTFSGMLYPYGEELRLIKGSNLYSRFFLFNFPVASKYSSYIHYDERRITIDISAERSDIINEPSTPEIFKTELFFRIKDIPYKVSGNHSLPITIRCNKKVIFTRVPSKIFYKNNVIIIRASLSKLKVSSITDDPYFKNRKNWHYPIYFDLRIEVVD